MTQRYQLTTQCYMPLDGLWQVVMPGTVFDAPDSMGVHTSTATKLSPAEPATRTIVNNAPASVRNVRTAA
jgi:hypothetical protein